MASAAPPRGTSIVSATVVSLGPVGARAAHTATTLADGSLFVAGGCVVDGCGSATNQTFIVSSDGSSAGDGPRMSVSRDSHTATLLPDGRVLLVGGFAGEGEAPATSVDLFDPATATITGSGDLRVGRGGHAAALTGDGRVLVVGGWVAPRTYTASTELIDLAAGAVSAGPDLPFAADALDAVTLADGRVLVTGGQIEPGVATPAAAIFDPATDSWVETGPLITPRFKHTGVRLGNGTVLIIGGTSDDREILSTTEVFDPSNGSLSRGPDLAEARYKLPGGAVLVGDDRVVVAGGGRSVEVIDLATGSSRVVDRFATVGRFATLNLLGSGDLLVLGGYDERIDLRREAHLITLDVP